METESSLSPPTPTPSLSDTSTLPIVKPAVTSTSLSDSSSSSSSSNPVVKVQNGWKTEKEGLIYVSVKGGPRERGMAHGQLLADRIIKFIRTYAYYIYDHTGFTIHLFIQMMADLYMTKSSLDVKYQEIMQEVEGIAAGVADAVKTGKNISNETKEIVDTTTTPPRIKLTEESYPPKNYDTFSSSVDKQYVTIDAKIIFLLNGIVSLFYTFPYLEKLLNDSESKYKKNPIYQEFLSKKTYTSSTLEKPSFFKKLFSGGQGQGADKCSAFMAVGPTHTKDGGIVYSHITFDDFMSGQFDNIILNLQTSTPETPSSVSADILMQTFPGGIFSSTDFFITTHGFMGTETTIGGFDSFELKAPICFRARKAMQYAKTLDDYVTFLSENNSGDYACSWYIGRVKRTETDAADEIMRIELGRRFINVERKTDGYFIGFNAAYDARIRNIECANDGFYDSRRHQGSRRIRLEEIISQCKEGKIKIDEDLAIKIISDHKDVYLDNRENPCSRTICAHYDEDKREYMSDPSRPKPNQPRGAVDAKVGSSKLYKENKFLAIWGRACGAPFDPETFCKKYILWDNQKKYLEARPTRAWVTCKCVLVDNVSNASTALEKYKDSVYSSKDIDIFSGSGDASSSSLTTSPTSSTTTSPSEPLAKPVAPAPAAIPPPAPSATSAAATSSTSSSPVAGVTSSNNDNPPASMSSLRPSMPLDDNDFGGGKYNKKDMKNFMKMLKNKNKKSTKQVTKNRNTKKNRH